MLVSAYYYLTIVSCIYHREIVLWRHELPGQHTPAARPDSGGHAEGARPDAGPGRTTAQREPEARGAHRGAPGVTSFDQISRLVSFLGGRFVIEMKEAPAAQLLLLAGRIARRKRKREAGQQGTRGSGKGLHMPTTLGVWMNGQRVGTWSVVRGTHRLQYDAGWVDSPAGRVLSLHFLSLRATSRSVVTRSRTTSTISCRTAMRSAPASARDSPRRQPRR